MKNCETGDHQRWRLYENGEILNDKSNYCLDVAGRNGWGNIGMFPCNEDRDQLWYQTQRLKNGKFNSLVNKKAYKCLDVYGVDGKGGVGIGHCEGAKDQRFKWVADKYITPTIKWK